MCAIHSVMSCPLRPCVVCQTPLFMGFSRQGPCPPPGDLSDPGLKPVSPKSPALADGFFTTSATWEALDLVLAPSYAPKWASLVAQMVKNLPAMQETQVRSLVWEDPLEKGMVNHSSILAWRIPWREESGELIYGVTKSRTGLSN